MITPDLKIVTGELAQALAEGEVEDREAHKLALRSALAAMPVGLHAAVPDTVYHSRVLGIASKSALDIVAQSPAHYRAWLAEELVDEDSKALRFGRALDCAVLEPDLFMRRYAVEPDFGDCRKKENKARREEWRAEHAGAEAVSADDYATIVGMARRGRAHEVVRPLLHKGRAQVMAKWEDPGTGLVCKSLLDYYLEDVAVVVDMKSARDASPKGFGSAVGNYGYDRQAAFYKRGLHALGRPLRRFVFMVFEKTPPFECAAYDLSPEWLALGDATIERDLLTLADCIARDTWPGYSDHEIKTLHPPAWALR